MNETASRRPGQAALGRRGAAHRAGAAAVARFGHKADRRRRPAHAGRGCARSLRGGAAARRRMRRRSRPSAAQLLEREDAPSLRRVFNLTGTVLHTNLGRARAGRERRSQPPSTAMRYAVALEFDLGGGAARRARRSCARPALRADRRRGRARRQQQRRRRAARAQHASAPASEAIVSRGELIEIGGAFRMPDIMARAGARLVEVGTTNRTHLEGL